MSVRRSLPPLSSLRAFEATARLGSVTRAAEELGRTHGAVSRQIRLLQERAGVTLFDKAGTGVRLNGRGEAFLPCVREALDGVARGWGDLLDEARGPSLHVACSATFAMRWLVPRLAEFQRREPAIRLRLSMTTARELRHEGADLVIAWDRDAYPAVEQASAIHLAEVRFGPVCSPSYPVRVGPDGLAAPVLIAHEHSTRAWDEWRKASGLGAQGKDEIRFPHTHLLIEAAAAGLGVALVEWRHVKEEIASGRLVAPLGFVALPSGLAAVPTSARAAGAAGRAFVSWIRETLSTASDA